MTDVEIGNKLMDVNISNITTSDEEDLEIMTDDDQINDEVSIIVVTPPAPPPSTIEKLEKKEHIEDEEQQQQLLHNHNNIPMNRVLSKSSSISSTHSMSDVNDTYDHHQHSTTMGILVTSNSSSTSSSAAPSPLHSISTNTISNIVNGVDQQHQSTVSTTTIIVETTMDLTQLLSCFPHPPSYVPVVPTQPHSKSRRDTIVFMHVSQPQLTSSTSSLPHHLNNNNNNNSSFSSSTNSLASLMSSTSNSSGVLSNAPSTNSLAWVNNNSNNSTNVSTNNLEDLKNEKSDTAPPSPSISMSSIFQSRESILSSPDSGTTTPSKVTSPLNLTVDTSQSTNNHAEVIAAAMTSPKLLKSNPEVSISYSSGNNGNTAGYRLTPRSINFTSNTSSTTPTSSSTPQQPTFSSATSSCSSSPSTPTQAPSTPIALATPFQQQQQSISSPSPTLPIATTLQVAAPLSPEWEVNLNLVEMPPPLRINSDVAENPDPVFDQLARCYKGEIGTSSQEHGRMLNSLLAHENHVVSMYLDRCHEYVTTPTAASLNQGSAASPNAISRRSIIASAVKRIQNDNGERPSIRLSKTLISHGGTMNKTIGVDQAQTHPAPINIELVSTITVSATSSRKTKFKVLLGPSSKTHNLVVEPMEGVLKKKESRSMTIRLTLKTSVRMRRAIVVEVEGGLRHYIIVHAETRPTPFGMPLDKCDMVEDGQFKTVPSVLVQLKQHLLAHTGVSTESLFRLPPNDERTMMITRERDWTGKQPIAGKDMHNSAALIKMFFRELRTPLLASLSPDTFSQFDQLVAISSPTDLHNKIEQIISLIIEPNRCIFLWIIDLLTTISNNESINKMSSKNLAVVFSPNLYISPNNLLPQDSLTLSSKVVNFINHVILYTKNKQNL